MTRQVVGEDETAYEARTNQATYRCGNVHSEDEKMTFYVDGLMPNIRTIVARFRENEFRHDMTFELLIQFAKDEGDAARARLEVLRPTGTITPGILKPTRRSPPPPRTLAFIEPTVSSQDLRDASQDASGNAEPLLALSASNRDHSIVTSDLPSTAKTEPSQQLDEKAL